MLLIIGIVLMVLGFIITYKGVFFCKYEVFNFAFLLMVFTITGLVDDFKLKFTYLVCLFGIGLFLHYDYDLRIRSILVKGKYLVFNIKAQDLLITLGEILKELNISYQIDKDSIIINDSGGKTLRTKSKSFNLTFLYLSDIYNTDLYNALIENLNNYIDENFGKKTSWLGIILLCCGFISIAVSYIFI